MCHFALGQGPALTIESASVGICRLAPWIPAVPVELLRTRQVCGSWLELTDWRDGNIEHSANARRLCVYRMTDWLHASFIAPTLTAQTCRHCCVLGACVTASHCVVRADASEATLRCLMWLVALLDAAFAVHVRRAPVNTSMPSFMSYRCLQRSTLDGMCPCMRVNC